MNRLWSEVVRILFRIWSDMPSAIPNEVQTNDNVQTLQHLNEYCLLEIFESKLLTPMDLCSLAETCTRFKRITKRVFPKDYKIFPCHDYRHGFTSKNYHRNDCTLQDVERILKNFGSHLSTLRAEGDLKVVNLVAKHCGDVALKRLEISWFDSIERVRVQLNSIFQRLLELDVVSCDLFVACPGLRCDSLTDLQIERSTGCVAIMKHTFPNLKRFTWETEEKEDDHNNSAILVWFLRHHGHLKFIYLKARSIWNCDLLHVIGSSCSELEELRLGEYTKRKTSFDISHLQSLRKLKLLRLDCEYGFGQHDQPYCHPIEFSQALESLETVVMHIEKVPPQFFDVLSQLENLRTLFLNVDDFGDIPWTRLARLRKLYLSGRTTRTYSAVILTTIKQLINLEEFEYEWSLTSGHHQFGYLNKETFSEIVKVVQPRGHLLTLKCYCKFKSTEICDASQKVVRLINYYDED